MKKLLAICGLVAVSLMLASCDGGTTPGELNLTFTVVNSGTDVQLDWDQIEGADYYTIDVDGTIIDSTADNTVVTYTVTAADAGKVITVTAVGADKDESVDFESTVETGDLGSNFGEASSTDYYSAAGFNQDGDPTVYSLLDNGNYSNFDFWISDGAAGTDIGEIDLVSPNATYGGTGNFNSEGNYSTAWGTGYVAPTSGYLNIYPGAGGIVNGSSYALWIDPSDNGWDLNDHFVRLDCTGIGGDGQVTMNTNYQTVGGLLWVPVD